MNLKIKNKLINSFRSFRYTKKGKKIGFDPSWNCFENFKNDMEPLYSKDKILLRKDKNKNFSKENCYWGNKGEENDYKSTLLIHNNKTKSLKEWCNELNLNYCGVRQRYFKGKNYTSSEVLFGKRISNKKSIQDFKNLSKQSVRNKASKMISAYKCKDYKKSLNCDLDIDWFIENILNKNCIYCNSNLHIGADRLNNSLGHLKNNIVPCCYKCNTIRNNFFTFEEMKKIGKFLELNIYNK